MSESCCPTSDTDDHCAVPESAAKPQVCPTCGSEGPTVDPQTVAAMTRGHLAPKQNFWLCRQAECETVYHGGQGALFSIGDMHVVPGFKTPGAEGLVCYCFMHSRGEIEQELRANGETTVPQRITAEIKAGNCACEVRNPAGRCCLGEVNKAVAMIRDRLAEIVA